MNLSAPGPSSSTISGDTYYNTNDIPINSFQKTIDPAILEQPWMVPANSTGQRAQSERHEVQPMKLPHGLLSTSSTYYGNSTNSTAQFGHQTLPTSDAGPRFNTAMVNFQGLTMLSILNTSGQFKPVTNQHNYNHELSDIHPVALRLLGWGPLNLHESSDVFNQAPCPCGCKPLKRFVRLAVKLEGCPAASLMDFLVCDDDVSYIGIDVRLGRRFIKGKGVHQPLEAHVSVPGGMLPTQPSIDFPKTTQNNPANLPSWPQAGIETSSYAECFPSVPPVPLAQTDMSSLNIMSTDMVGAASTGLGDEWLSFAPALGYDGLHASIKQEPMVLGHNILPSYQPMAFPDVSDVTEGVLDEGWLREWNIQ